ncbi:hypothetical protein D1819_18195 [Pseudoalteromonas tunicata]|uniref:Uncharacterized protein n=1 Tax=Pseudoalteromonas tunicata D2 TaxID=87626 RepID=A4C3I5_9GAMM|nr:hypothetical protein D1819_18195 [Pseudoalteromonas tunicata]EAR30117.1 hypothetical protein PTD2_01071 [Pseudoalteromonas tunicata D2]
MKKRCLPSQAGLQLRQSQNIRRYQQLPRYHALKMNINFKSIFTTKTQPLTQKLGVAQRLGVLCGEKSQFNNVAPKARPTRRPSCARLRKQACTYKKPFLL